MKNTHSKYDKIKISVERDPIHYSNDRKINVIEYLNFDADFFKGKIVIIFDDVVTRGSSIAQFSKKLNEIGAYVICAISIGRTVH